MHQKRVLQPAEGIFGFYDGRIDDYRFTEGPNWVDSATGTLITSPALHPVPETQQRSLASTR
jgi:hypothetical protein